MVIAQPGKLSIMPELHISEIDLDQKTFSTLELRKVHLLCTHHTTYSTYVVCMTTSFIHRGVLTYSHNTSDSGSITHGVIHFTS